MSQFIQLSGKNETVDFLPLSLIMRARYHPDGKLEIRRLDTPTGNVDKPDITLEGDEAQHVLRQLNAAMIMPAASRAKTKAKGRELKND